MEGENNATSPGTPWSKAGGGHGGGDSEGTATRSHWRRTARFLAQCREVGDGEGMRGGSPERPVATGSPPGRLASGAGTFLHGHRWQEGNDQGTGGSVYIFNGRELRWGSHLCFCFSNREGATCGLGGPWSAELGWLGQLAGQRDVQGAQYMGDCWRHRSPFNG